MATKKKVINHYSFDKGYANTNKVIAGLDLSLRHSGIIILNDEGEIVHQESIVLLDRQKDRKKYYKMKFKVNGEYIDEEIDCTTKNHTLDHYQRIIAIRNRVMALMRLYKVNAVAIEGYSYGSFKKGVLAQIAESSSLVKSALYEKKIPFYIVPPKSLKVFIAGNGNAKKHEIQHAILKKYFLSFEDDNEADAFGLASLLMELGEEIEKFCEKRGPDLYRKQREILKLK